MSGAGNILLLVVAVPDQSWNVRSLNLRYDGISALHYRKASVDGASRRPPPHIIEGSSHQRGRTAEKEDHSRMAAVRLVQVYRAVDTVKREPPCNNVLHMSYFRPASVV